MRSQPRYDAYEASDFPPFADGASARTLVAGTVARGYLRLDRDLYPGAPEDTPPGVTAGIPPGEERRLAPLPAPPPTSTATAAAARFPFPVTLEVLLRGQERFTIYCTPCHGRLGDGDGIIVARGFSRPPTFHSDALRQAPPGHFFDVISRGRGQMPSYAAQVPVRDRWAITAYIRALQLSQHAPAADLPPEDRQRLGEAVAP